MEEKNLDIQYSMFADMNSRKGVYSNFAAVKTVNEEVIIDFALVDEIHEGNESETREGILVSRVIMTPREAASLANAITKHIAKHFGSEEE